MPRESLRQLLVEIRNCEVCKDHLPLGPRPVVSASGSAKILIVGQAPGIRVHQSGIAWNDPSGNRLREWMGITDRQFYDEKQVALVPMGFCYPGTTKTGDMPPRPECAPLWQERLLKKLKSVELTLLLGQYSQKQFLGKLAKRNLTATVENWKEYRPKFLPMPHPSPRNNRWLKNNPWFEKDLLPWLKRRVTKLVV